MKRIGASVATAVLGLALLSACSGSDSDGSVTDPAGSGGGAGSGASAGEMPTSVPPPEGEVVGVGTVMDTGQGDPQLCLGAIAESYPPQCSGIPITNWDWAPVKDTSEASGTTRWGSYAVTGTYDGETFTVTQKPMSSALYDPAAPADNPFVTSCPEPEGGWGVVDDSQGCLRGPGRRLHRGGPAVDVRRLVHRPDRGRGLGRGRQRQHRQRAGDRGPRGRRDGAAQGLGRPAVRERRRAHRGRARRDPGRPAGPSRSAQQRPTGRQARGRRRLGRRHAADLGRRGVRRGPVAIRAALREPRWLAVEARTGLERRRSALDQSRWPSRSPRLSPARRPRPRRRARG